MTADNRAGGVLARFFTWLPALLAAQLVLTGTAVAVGMGTAAWPPPVKGGIAAFALGQGLLTLLRALPLLLLLSWPCLRLGSPRARLLATGMVWSVFLLVQAALERYFQVAGTPLGADLFGYSRAEIATTLAGGAHLGTSGMLVLALPLLVLWAALYGLRRWQPEPRQRLAVTAVLAGLAGWGLPLAPGTGALPGDTARALAGNKLAWFTADSLRWLQRPAGDAAGVVAPASADEPPLDPHYPFLHPERTPDALGPYFAATSDGAPPNLVVIVVEGLGRSFSGPQAELGSFTPFLDDLATRSLYFENFLANQGRTFGVLPSLLGSLPFGEQGFAALGERMPPHPGLFNVLHRQGYHTAFYSGTDAGFDNERAYLRLQQLDAVVDLKNFGSGYQLNPLSSWGYPDRELVSRVLADSTGLQTPFALAMQTISMHTSYQFPGQDRYRARVEQRLQQLAVPASQLPAYRANADIYSTILYTDDQLRRYFESAAQMPWYRNTVFVITGDHRLPEIPMGEHIDRYHVPLLVFSPLLKQPAQVRAVSSHLDVTPSLLALFAHTYGLQRPAQVPWLGTGLDMGADFRNQHEIPLQQTKTSDPEYLVDRWWLRDGQLFELGDGMHLSPVDDTHLQAWVTHRLQRYRSANATFLRQLALMPDGEAPPLLAFAAGAAAADAAPRSGPPARAVPGITLESVQLGRAGDAIDIHGIFANGDPVPSAAFVPLAVLSSEDGREVQEASGGALQLAAHERRAVRLTLRHPGLVPGRYYVSVRPSDPDTGQPLGRGRFHIPFDFGADTGAGAPP
ncbi:LTA synthase family protein [Stenotrophomonas sp. YIM B06876]|uniref:LTA synthase family protein n=1 Tax=Stenotrophomonas sp. YIM B06876 TaxID=3060211 RepID=UPI0027391EC2|nr:LTA synthase family protein [Stenotrophomonas sp. YIM B06876]